MNDSQDKIICMTDSKGNCSRCGQCCGAAPIPITRKEEKRIRQYLKTHKILPTEHIYENVEDKVNITLTCPFFNSKEKKCNIYEVRPEICKTFKCNMTQEKCNDMKTRIHDKAYWNYIPKKTGIPKNLTNFSLLFYGNITDLFMWFWEGLSYIKDKEKRFNAIFTIFEKGGIKIDEKFKEQARRFVNGS